MRLVEKIVVMLLLSCGVLAAQEVTGSITGVVTDRSGAVVPGADVTVTNVDQNKVIRQLKTNGSGQYVAALLPVGHYSVKVAAPKYRTFERSGVMLNVSDRLLVNAELKPGSVSERIEVSADALQVQSQDATAQGLINGTQVRELSLSQRNYEEMVALVPGVSSAVSDTIYAGVETPGGGTNQVSFSINGTRFSQNNWTIDGVDNVDRGGNFSLLNYPSVDAIEEFNVMRSLYSPEYGRGAGGQIAVITRSGTNKLHGGVYEFFRNDKLNANRYFNKVSGLERSPLRYNDFGWTLGGPVVIPHVYNGKNKTFFFFSQEFRRIVTYSTNEAIVPNADERAGIFSSDVCIAGSGGAGCTVLPAGTPLSPGLLNPAAAAYLKDVYSKIPLPQDPSTDQLFNTARSQFNYRQEIIRLDHTFSQALSFTGRFINDSIPTINPSGLFGASNVLGYATTDTNSPGRSLLLRFTHSIRPTLLNEVGYASSFGAIESTVIGYSSAQSSPDVVSAIKLPFASALPRIPNLDFQNGDALGGFGPYGDYNRDYNIFDNLTWIRGRHTWKFGGTFHRYSKSENDAGGYTSPNGSFVFQGTDPTGNSTFQQEFASFLTGNVSSFSQSNQDFRAQIRQRMLEFFVQDEFRWKPNVTVSYGIRYTHYGQPFDANHQNTSFLPSAFSAANAPTLATDGTSTFICTPDTVASIPDCSGAAPNPNYNPLNGLIVSTGNPSAVSLGATPSPWGAAVTQQNKLDFGPRIGISWDPTNTGKMAIRTGYGLFFDSPAIGYVENNLFNNPPFVTNINIANTVFHDPGSVAPTPNSSPISLRGVAENWKLPYTQAWSFDVQTQLPKTLILDIGYYGNMGTHLLGLVDQNQPLPGAAVAAGLGDPANGGINQNNYQVVDLVRPYQGYGPIELASTVFTSNYHSLQIGVQKRFGGGSQAALNYTWSHALTTAGNDFSSPQNSRDIKAEYGPADFDRRHIFTADYVYVFPFYKDQQGVIGHLAGGWEVSGIVTLNSGLWLTPLGNAFGVDPAGLGLFNPGVAGDGFTGSVPFRPDQASNPNSGAPNSVNQWFNTGAFVSPAGPGAPGNARRGSILGPGIARWDMSLFKNIRIGERISMQFRAEGFNILNHTNFDGVDTNVSSGTYGQVVSAHEPRIVQIGLKLNF